MKRIYLAFVAMLACSLMASAEDKDLIINVTGADRVLACIGESVGFNDTFDPEKCESVTLVEGENIVKVPDNLVFYAKPANSEDIFSFKDRDGDSPYTMSNSDWFYIYGESTFYNPYTIVCASEAEYRNKSVTITMDDCSKVTIQRADAKTFNPETNTITIPYNPEKESLLQIKPRNYGEGLYKVLVDGKEATKSSSGFSVNLVDKSGDEPAYAENIEVLANYPEDLKYKVTIALDAPKEIVKYIRVNGTDVDDIAACLTEEGFEVAPMAVVAIGLDDNNYEVTKLTDNGSTKYVYSQLTIDGIDCDHNIVIEGAKLSVYTVTVNVTGAEGVVAEYNYDDYTFVEGENTIKATKKSNHLEITQAPGWEITKLTDSEGYDYLEDYNWSWYHEASLYLKEGVTYTIEAIKIERNNQIVVYVDDMDLASLDYVTCGFKNFDVTESLTSGYNVFNFREQDGEFSIYLSTYSGLYSNLVSYKNAEILPASYDGAKYREDEKVAHNDVYKFFFDNDPGTHTVTFDVDEELLDALEVSQDIITEVDLTAPAVAVGPTLFTLTPSEDCEAEITVKVGDAELEAVEGTYTFETTADTTVEVKAKDNSGVDNVLTAGADTADVYNLQGIRVARNASAADVKALPAGLYIVNGAKVLVK
ncbi:MAG: hypothetical protein HDS65_02055 [Bacteroidales bacterium]|nr:hypothetical protein [Bacteroidales bacterium]